MRLRKSSTVAKLEATVGSVEFPKEHYECSGFEVFIRQKRALETLSNEHHREVLREEARRITEEKA